MEFEEGSHAGSEGEPETRNISELSLPPAQPSPRRLRSRPKDEGRQRAKLDRKAKPEDGTLKESSTEEDMEEAAGDGDEENDDNEMDDAEEAEEAQDIDELDEASADNTPRPHKLRRTRSRSESLKSQSKSQGKRPVRPRRAQTYTPPSDADDDGEAGDDGEASAQEEEVKVLRNGKKVGVDVDEEVDGDDVEEVDEEMDVDEVDEVEEEDADVTAEEVGDAEDAGEEEEEEQVDVDETEEQTVEDDEMEEDGTLT